MSRRFFVEQIGAIGENLALPKDEAHHAASVLRLQVGAPVEIFDGSGRLGHGTLETVGKRAATLRVDRIETPADTAPLAQIACAVPKGKRWQTLIEKCTELGVASIQPIRFHRSVAEGGGADKWLRWTLEAVKQCNRLRLPMIAPVVDFAAWLSAVGSGWVLADAAGISPTESQRIAGILIGPEGGLTEEEFAACDRAGLGRVRLGPHILRTETAAIAACAVQQWSKA